MQLNTGRYLEAFALTTIVFCGTVQYFTGVVAVLWLPFFMVLVMVVLLMMQSRQQPLALSAREKVVLALYLTFIILSLCATVLQSGIVTAIVGFKNELALSLVMFCMLLGMFRESQLHRLTQLFYWLFYVQFPLAIYQVLVVVPKRVALRGEDEKWDSVVGTFGGDPMGGGNTAAMGMFCLLIMLLKVSEFKHGICSFKSMAAHIVLAFFLCVVGEVKFVILLSPFLLALLWIMPAYVSGISKVTLRSLMIIAAGMVVLILPLSPFSPPTTRRPLAGIRPKARSRYLSIPSVIFLILTTLWKAASLAGLPLFSSGLSITNFLAPAECYLATV